MVRHLGLLSISLLLSLTVSSTGCRSPRSESQGLSLWKRLSPGSSTSKLASSKSRHQDPLDDRDPADERPGRLASAWDTLRGRDPQAKQQADVQISFAQMQASQGEIAGAIKSYEEALQMDPTRADAHWRLATLLDQQGEFEQSEMHFRKAIAKQPNNTNLHADFGYSLYLRGLLSDAEAELQKALKLDPHNRRAHNNLGLVLTAQRQPEEALAEFRKAGLSLAEAKSNLGFALALQGSMHQAEAAYQEALERDPNLQTAQDGQKSLVAVADRLHEADRLQAERSSPRPESIEQADLTTFDDEIDADGKPSSSRVRRVRQVFFGKQSTK